ncbi:MAG: hypothetical protein GXO25_07605 [Euryarchaeota archaeon]|nr:hypothetical protein [Euryarchaeota archaeon]
MQPTNGISEGNVIIKEGKLIRFHVQFHGERIRKIRINGDFFLYPEEKLEELEQKLENQEISSIENVIRSTFSECEYAGISPEIVERGIKEAWTKRR